MDLKKMLELDFITCFKFPTRFIRNLFAPHHSNRHHQISGAINQYNKNPYEIDALIEIYSQTPLFSFSQLKPRYQSNLGNIP